MPAAIVGDDRGLVGKPLGDWTPENPVHGERVDEGDALGRGWRTVERVGEPGAVPRFRLMIGMERLHP
jgi:hypothetical protein